MSCEERQTQLEFLEPRQHEAAGMARLARHGMEQCARRHDAMGWSGGRSVNFILPQLQASNREQARAG